MLERMKRRGKSLGVLAAIALVTSAADANQVHDRVSKLPEPKRNEVLTEFMARSGDSCEVRKSFFQGLDERKTAFWSVACSNKKSFAIMMNDDGSNTILECNRLKAVSGVDCFKAF